MTTIRPTGPSPAGGPRRRAGTWAAFAFLACLIIPGDAFAAGFYLPGRGVKPLGRAGAFVASADDPNAIWYNPANLTLLESTTLTVDVGLIDLAFEFQRAPRQMGDIDTDLLGDDACPSGTLGTADGRRICSYEAIANEAPPKVDPQILVGGPLGYKNMKWGAGVYAPYLSGHTFPETGAQRYVLVDNDASLLLFLHFAVAMELGENFRIGAGIQNVISNFVLVNVTSAYTGLFGDPEDPELDILTRITMGSFFTPSGNIGAWWKLAPTVEAAFSIQGPVIIRDDSAKMEVKLPANVAFDNARLEGDTLSGGLNFPLIARLGLRYVDEGAFDVEAAFVYEAWSIFDKISASPNNVAVAGVPGLGAIPVGPLDIPKNFEDTLSFRLGSDVNVSENFTIRFGYGFETAAIPDETYSVFLADANKHMLALGATQALGQLKLDASLAYYLMEDRTITNSETYQINPTDEANKITLVVGNGAYTQRYLAGGLALTYAF